MITFIKLVLLPIEILIVFVNALTSNNKNSKNSKNPYDKWRK